MNESDCYARKLHAPFGAQAEVVPYGSFPSAIIMPLQISIIPVGAGFQAGPWTYAVIGTRAGAETRPYVCHSE
jgi:hypothetical protein